MKKLLFLPALLLMVVAYSCSDLEEDPIGLLAPESFFKTPRDLETAALGTYAWIASEEFYGRKLVLSLLLRGDMADIGDRGTPGRRQNVNDFEMDSNNGMVTAFWPRAYLGIGAANAVIDGAVNVEGNQDEIDAVVAEARFQRAFLYYHLVRLFGDIPYIDFAITDPAAVEDISKTPADQVYAGIIADLEFAVDNLPDIQRDGVRTRPSKGTASAYLASVHMTLENWDASYNAAKFVIDNKDAFNVRLMDDFADLYKAETANGLPEHLFAVDFLANQTGNSRQNQDWMGPITGIREVRSPSTTAEGWSVAVPAFRVYETWDDRDYRKSVSFIDSAVLLTSGEKVGFDQFAVQRNASRPHIAKYFEFCGGSRRDCGISDNNYVAFRYAEVLLIAAESGLKSGKPESEVLGYINQIRKRARRGEEEGFPADVEPGLGTQALSDLIIEERRLELAFEFKRWYDIKRLQIGEEVFKGPNSLEPHPNFDASRDYLFPLPQDELDRNGNLAPQNPGY